MRSFIGFFGGFALSVTGCVGTTGGDIVDFEAGAAGPKDVVRGESLSFTTDRGVPVELTRATLHVGAMYLDQALPVSGAQSSTCILPGTYVAEVTDGIDVDLLDPTPTKFPGEGHGTTSVARAGQVWLTHDDVNAGIDPSGKPILSLEGTTTIAGEEHPFSAVLTISSNRQAAGAVAGANPICKERIVSPIATEVSVQEEGALLLRIDPRLLFTNVDMSALTLTPDGYVFSDDPTAATYTQPSLNLYSNLHSGGSVYTFSWTPRLD
ncbi:MAG TPA: hypothetical protein VH062_29075 [Polyangiaceae bacterium]|jgi:hypothetical protein|nr:hypothetical protein [Polyangiaceae bacterium]